MFIPTKLLRAASKRLGQACEIRGSSFVDGGAGIGDESHFEFLGMA